jgi:hypothetical protein
MCGVSSLQLVLTDATAGQGEIGAPVLRPALRLRGTSYAMGVEHGRRLGWDIVTLERAFLTFLAQLYGGGRRGRRRALTLYRVARLIAGAVALRYWPARYREELRGIAAGMRRAGCGSFGLTRLAVINSFDDLAAAWGTRWLACSAFAVRGEYGGILVGRNLDYQVIPQTLTALNAMFIYHPVGRIPFVSWGWPGYIGVATGVNAQRLSLSLLSSPTHDASPLGIPEGLANRLVLEEAQTLSQAFEELTALPRTVGANLLLATPDRACVLESSRSCLVRRDMRGGRLAVTNHYQTAAMARRQAEFAPMSTCHLDERFLSLAGSHQRARTLEAALRVGMTAPEAIHLLTDAALVSNGQVQSLVMDLAGGDVWLAAGPGVPACRAGYHYLEWRALFT